MDQPTFDPTHRASRAVAYRVGVVALRRVARGACRLTVKLVVNVTIWVAGGVVLLPVAAKAQDAGGPIVIAGPGEKNPAALAALAEQMQAAPPKRAGSPATLAGATAQSLSSGSKAREADAFTRAAQADGAIVIDGTGTEATAATPRMIATTLKPDANGVVTIPGPGAGVKAAAANGLTRVNFVPDSRQVVPVVISPAPQPGGTRPRAGVQPVAVNAPHPVDATGLATANGFDSLASRGEPPQLGANGKPLPARVAATVPVANAAAVATASLPAVATAANNNAASPSSTSARGAASARMPASPASQNARAALPARGAPLAGQQDPEAIRQTALAFLQQQSAGLPGKIDITIAPAFPRGLAACTSLEPFLPSGARLWGQVSVGVRCVGERPWTMYLQARVSLHATYYLAARAMLPGEVLGAADLVAREGDLTYLPQAIVTDPSQVIGATTLTRVAGGSPLRLDMLKSASAVSIGQTVRVVAAGVGFAISAEGSAMNNASPGQSVRVKTANGQIVSGIVKDGTTVEIQL